MNAGEVTALRVKLGLTKPSFARLVGCNLRTLNRWEDGEVKPKGTSSAVMRGFIRALENTESHDAIVAILQDTAHIGGLSYLLIRLLDNAVRNGAHAHKRAPRESPRSHVRRVRQ